MSQRPSHKKEMWLKKEKSYNTDKNIKPFNIIRYFLNVLDNIPLGQPTPSPVVVKKRRCKNQVYRGPRKSK